jgi:hypothetical protein
MKVYHVELTVPFDGQTHFYFGSQTAIFDYFTDGQLGRISLRSLISNNDLAEKEYKNKSCIIRLGELRRKHNTKERSKK